MLPMYPSMAFSNISGLLHHGRKSTNSRGKESVNQGQSTFQIRSVSQLLNSTHDCLTKMENENNKYWYTSGVQVSPPHFVPTCFSSLRMIEEFSSGNKQDNYGRERDYWGEQTEQLVYHHLQDSFQTVFQTGFMIHNFQIGWERALNGIILEQLHGDNLSRFRGWTIKVVQIDMLLIIPFNGVIHVFPIEIKSGTKKREINSAKKQCDNACYKLNEIMKFVCKSQYCEYFQYSVNPLILFRCDEEPSKRVALDRMHVAFFFNSSTQQMAQLFSPTGLFWTEIRKIIGNTENLYELNRLQKNPRDGIPGKTLTIRASQSRNYRKSIQMFCAILAFLKIAKKQSCSCRKRLQHLDILGSIYCFDATKFDRLAVCKFILSETHRLPYLKRFCFKIQPTVSENDTDCDDSHDESQNLNNGHHSEVESDIENCASPSLWRVNRVTNLPTTIQKHARDHFDMVTTEQFNILAHADEMAENLLIIGGYGCGKTQLLTIKAKEKLSEALDALDTLDKTGGSKIFDASVRCKKVIIVSTKNLLERYFKPQIYKAFSGISSLDKVVEFWDWNSTNSLLASSDNSSKIMEVQNSWVFIDEFADVGEMSLGARSQLPIVLHRSSNRIWCTVASNGPTTDQTRLKMMLQHLDGLNFRVAYLSFSLRSIPTVQLIRSLIANQTGPVKFSESELPIYGPRPRVVLISPEMMIMKHHINDIIYDTIAAEIKHWMAFIPQKHILLYSDVPDMLDTEFERHLIDRNIQLSPVLDHLPDNEKWCNPTRPGVKYCLDRHHFERLAGLEFRVCVILDFGSFWGQRHPDIIPARATYGISWILGFDGMEKCLCDKKSLDYKTGENRTEKTTPFDLIVDNLRQTQGIQFISCADNRLPNDHCSDQPVNTGVVDCRERMIANEYNIKNLLRERIDNPKYRKAISLEPPLFLPLEERPVKWQAELIIRTQNELRSDSIAIKIGLCTGINRYPISDLVFQYRLRIAMHFVENLPSEHTRRVYDYKLGEPVTLMSHHRLRHKLRNNDFLKLKIYFYVVPFHRHWLELENSRRFLSLNQQYKVRQTFVLFNPIQTFAEFSAGDMMCLSPYIHAPKFDPNIYFRVTLRPKGIGASNTIDFGIRPHTDAVPVNFNDMIRRVILCIYFGCAETILWQSSIIERIVVPFNENMAALGWISTFSHDDLAKWDTACSNNNDNSHKKYLLTVDLTVLKI